MGSASCYKLRVRDRDRLIGRHKSVFQPGDSRNRLVQPFGRNGSCLDCLLHSLEGGGFPIPVLANQQNIASRQHRTNRRVFDAIMVDDRMHF